MIEMGDFAATSFLTGDNEEFSWLLRIQLLQLLPILVDLLNTLNQTHLLLIMMRLTGRNKALRYHLWEYIGS